MPQSEGVSPGKKFVASSYLCWSVLREVLERELPGGLSGPPVTLQAVRVLRFLSRLQPQAIGEIADFLGVSDAAASKLIDRMVRSRWLRRAQSVPDRRVWKVCLTATSVRLLRAYDRALEAGMSTLFRDCPEKELRAAAAILDRVAVQIMAGSATARRPCMRCGSYVRDDCPLRAMAEIDCVYARYDRRTIISASGASPPPPHPHGNRRRRIVRRTQVRPQPNSRSGGKGKAA